MQILVLAAAWVIQSSFPWYVIIMPVNLLCSVFAIGLVVATAKDKGMPKEEDLPQMFNEYN